MVASALTASVGERLSSTAKVRPEPVKQKEQRFLLNDKDGRPTVGLAKGQRLLRGKTLDYNVFKRFRHVRNESVDVEGIRQLRT